MRAPTFLFRIPISRYHLTEPAQAAERIQQGNDTRSCVIALLTLLGLLDSNH
jgi:hypothetical protein